MDMMMVEHSEHCWADLMDDSMDMSRVCLLADLKDVHLVHHLVDQMDDQMDDQWV